MRGAVILIGDELLAGHTRDANGHFLAKRMAELGHRVRRIAVVPDERHAIVAEVDACLAAADVVFVSGGLGPTHDDRTTEALCERFGRKVVVDEPSFASMKARFDRRGKATPDMIEAARKMVSVPEGAEVLENPVGAAPGYVLRDGDRFLVVLPGVPPELQAIFEKGIAGKLVPQSTTGGSVLEVDIEMAEAAFALALTGVANRFADVEIGSYPHFGERRVTLRFRGEPARAAAAMREFFEKVPDAKRV